MEVTPDICVPCRELQQHINGDISFAARQYISATRDVDWLVNERGCEFIIDIARWWATRAEYDGDIDRYHISGNMKNSKQMHLLYCCIKTNRLTNLENGN